MRRLTIQAPLDSFTSYGITFQKIFFGLKKRGIHVSVRPTRISTPFGTKIPAEILASVVNGPQPEEWEVIFGPTLYLPTPGKKVFYWTTHEAPDMPNEKLDLLDQAEFVMLMNKDVTRRYADHVITRGSTNNGKVPRWVGYLPLGVDTDVFKPHPILRQGFFRFGTAGRLAHGWHRKGVDRVIKAFQDEFGPDDAVRLYVKLHPDCEFTDTTDARIIIQRQHLSESEIVGWLTRLDCYVSGAAYEGFGLWPLQAMAVGRPVIAFKASGLDYVGECRIACVDVPNEKEMGRHMREFYENGVRKEAVDWVGKRTLDKWSLDHCVDQFIERLEDCGALSTKGWIGRAVANKLNTVAKIKQRLVRTPTPRTSKIVHVYPAYRGSEADENRKEFAKATWSIDSGGVENICLPREFIDEDRRLPYVKDVIEHAAARCKLDDIILLTNSDICFASNLAQKIQEQVGGRLAVSFPRREFARLTAPVADDKIMEGQKLPGWDAFAFFRLWWDRNKSRMPDMLMGAEGWDSVMAELVGRENEIDGLVYHVAHVPLWKDNRFTISSQKYNRALARRFFKEEGVPSPIDPEPVAATPENLI